MALICSIVWESVHKHLVYLDTMSVLFSQISAFYWVLGGYVVNKTIIFKCGLCYTILK